MLLRRSFIKRAVGGGLAFCLYPPTYSNTTHDLTPHIACQQYPWHTFLKREGKNWHEDIPEAMKLVSSTGISGFEPLVDNEAYVHQLAPLFKQHKLKTHSLYVNSILHDPSEIEKSIAQVLAIADLMKPYGTQIVVTNPAPIQWGGDEDKTDEQLMIQAKALNTLGQKLRNKQIMLAYHNHDAEMRNSAREFHHMMNGTEPENVKLCLDSHWIYRGAGNSSVALFDIVKLYVGRVVELHLRQSREGVWTEAFEAGDIDYERLVEVLLAHDQHPHLVLEQAVEEGTPDTMNAVEAHTLSLAYVRKVFSPFLQ